MEMDMEKELERLALFQHTRTAAEAAYAKDPFDADNLTRWGSALLELSAYQKPSISMEMLRDAISKFEEALGINSTKADTLWLLGNSIMALAFLNPDGKVVGKYFSKAREHLQMACELEPGNQLYRKSFEVAAKAPELHAEFQKNAAQQAATTRQTSSSSTRTAVKKGKNSDLKYDIMGWVILGVATLAWVGFTKNNMAPSHDSYHPGW